MVDITQVRASNAQMAKQKATNGVFVFAGATGGIGLSTLRSVNQLVERSTFYVIGRSESRFHDQMSRLQADNAGKNKTVFLEAEFSLLKHVDAVCAKIAAAESKVDHVFMSPGMLPFQGPKCTYASWRGKSEEEGADERAQSRARAWTSAVRSHTTVGSGWSPTCFRCCSSRIGQRY